MNELGYFETRRLDVLVFSNRYNDLFSDSGKGFVAAVASVSYLMHKTFPNIVVPELTLRGLTYLY